MLTVKIIAFLIAAVLVVGGIVNFNAYTQRRFRHRFFALGPLILGAAAVWMVIGGVAWAQSPTAGVANGLVLAFVGALLSAGLVAYNVRSTNLVVGLGGSALQLATYTAAGLLGVVVAIPALFLAVAATFGRAEPTIRHGHVVHDYDFDHC